MLTQQAISAAYPLAEQLDANRVVLIPLAGTPLDALVRASRANSSLVEQMDNGEVHIDTYGIGNLANSKNDLYAESQHTYVMTDLETEAAATIRRVLNVARTQVAPMVAQLVELVTMRLNTAPPSQISQLTIESENNNAALFNPALANLVEKFQLTAVDNPPIKTALPRLGASEIAEFMTTGIASLDDDLATMVAGIPGYELEQVWQTFFCRLTAQPVDPNASTNAPMLTATRNDYSFAEQLATYPWAPVVVFVISRHLLDNDKVPEGTEMDLKDYNEVLGAYVQQSGVMINRLLERAALSVKNGMLVTTMAGPRITVNTPVYNAWLANGGDNDILYGMMVSGNPSFTLASITSRADEYKEAWARHVMITTAADSHRRFSFTREQLVLAFESILAKGDIAGTIPTATEMAIWMKAFKDELAQVELSETTDLYGLCLKLVARSRFPRTPAERILSHMDRECRETPGLAPREAGTLAILDYIIDWVFAQMQVTSA